MYPILCDHWLCTQPVSTSSHITAYIMAVTGIYGILLLEKQGLLKTIQLSRVSLHQYLAGKVPHNCLMKWQLRICIKIRFSSCHHLKNIVSNVIHIISYSFHYSDIIMMVMASQITQHLDCLLNHLFRRRSSKTSKLCITGLCEGNSPVTNEYPTQRASNKENVFIWCIAAQWCLLICWSHLCRSLSVSQYSESVLAHIFSSFVCVKFLFADFLRYLDILKLL